MISTILKWLVLNKNIVFKAFFGLSAAFLIICSVILYGKNKRLSESLELAQNNVESYESLIGNMLNEYKYTLELTKEQFLNSLDSTLQELDSVRNELGIKIKNLNTAATQTQTIYVSDSKGVKGDELLSTILEKYKTYSDSISYNELTKIYYTIGEDTVSVALDLLNTQYLYVFETKEYKNKKNFLKRLLTLDFKKVKRYKYEILNTNDLINTSDVRVVEVTE